MRTLIIPDLHLQHAAAEVLIERVRPDHTVFLGDYFDDYGDSPEQNAAAARWLKLSLREPDRTHLIGNHDTHYYARRYECGGFSITKESAIRRHLSGQDFHSLRWYAWVDNWLCTHAGIHPSWIPEDVTDFRAWLEVQAKDASSTLRMDGMHWTLASGRARGGGSQVGGLLWLDWPREFKPVTGLNQIVGHTPSIRVRQRLGEGSINYCLDAPGGAAIVDDGEIEILGDEQ